MIFIKNKYFYTSLLSVIFYNLHATKPRDHSSAMSSPRLNTPPASYPSDHPFSNLSEAPDMEAITSAPSDSGESDIERPDGNTQLYLINESHLNSRHSPSNATFTSPPTAQEEPPQLPLNPKKRFRKQWLEGRDNDHIAAPPPKKTKHTPHTTRNDPPPLIDVRASQQKGQLVYVHSTGDPMQRSPWPRQSGANRFLPYARPCATVAPLLPPNIRETLKTTLLKRKNLLALSAQYSRFPHPGVSTPQEMQPQSSSEFVSWDAQNRGATHAEQDGHKATHPSTHPVNFWKIIRALSPLDNPYAQYMDDGYTQCHSPMGDPYASNAHVPSSQYPTFPIPNASSPQEMLPQSASAFEKRDARNRGARHAGPDRYMATHPSAHLPSYSGGGVHVLNPSGNPYTHYGGGACYTPYHPPMNVPYASGVPVFGGCVPLPSDTQDAPLDLRPKLSSHNKRSVPHAPDAQ